MIKKGNNKNKRSMAAEHTVMFDLGIGHEWVHACLVEASKAQWCVIPLRKVMLRGNGRGMEVILQNNDERVYTVECSLMCY